jgi:hypothetical protein
MPRAPARTGFAGTLEMMPETPDWTPYVIAVTFMLATSIGAMREAAGPRARRRARKPFRQPPLPQASHADELGSPEPVATVQMHSPAREWLLDSLPLETAGAPRDRAGGAGRLVIGITGMAIAGALAILGISRAVSAVFDRFFR